MALSPMMQHYLQTKEKYKDAILLYRLGDFYEMFFEDAQICSRELELTLTGKDCGLEERAPMCGMPYHAVEGYIAKLINRGYKVAVCEQLTEPKKGVKIVERDVIRVITPGTLTDSSMLEEKSNNFIASIFKKSNNYSMSYVDITTGEFYTCEFNSEDIDGINDLLIQVKPSEVICNNEMYELCDSLGVKKLEIVNVFTPLDDDKFEFNRCYELLLKQLNAKNLVPYNINDKRYSIISAGALIYYLNETQKRSLANINNISLFNNTNYMYLDANTRRNLEICETLKDRKHRGTLLWLLDNTKTSMGGRKLKTFLEQPLNNLTEINKRLDAVEELTKNIILRQEISQLLKSVYDIERISGKIAYGNFMPRDAENLCKSLSILPQIKAMLSDVKSKYLSEIRDNIFDFGEIVKLLNNSISDNPPALLKDGGYIKKGYNKELDELRSKATEGGTWITNLEQLERQETGIKNLKIHYNKVFGYYIEVPKSQADSVPFKYQRRQTTVNSERFITPELKQMEDEILNASENSLKLEQQLFENIRLYLLENVKAMQITSQNIALLDVFVSFATVAVTNNYTRPIMNKNIKSIEIVNGRHPVVEVLNKQEDFVPNDTTLTQEDHTMIITGPNMAGKSTYMRQVALITLMAHIGCFVPASASKIALTDRIFTRVGASDDVAFGQSTFMVEMVEVSNIIHNATQNSLVLLDEVGRGTSTLDGLSIAWSVVDYLCNNIKCKTLFSTHYHELTELEGRIPGVKNYRITVKEFNNSIIFLRKIVRGGTNKSFGIEVASIAGIPKQVTDKAKEILHDLQQNDILKESNLDKLAQTSPEIKINTSEIISQLKDIDINTLTPLNAFDILLNLKDKVK